MGRAEDSTDCRCTLSHFRLHSALTDILDCFISLQGPDAVHIQQVGQRELKRAPGLAERTRQIKLKEKAILEKAGLKAKL